MCWYGMVGGGCIVDSGFWFVCWLFVGGCVGYCDYWCVLCIGGLCCFCLLVLLFGCVGCGC